MSETFSENVKKHYEEACRKNKNQHNSYFCATSSGTTERILDLNSEFVFLKPQPGLRKSKANKINEYKLAAFMVREALKEPNCFLPLKEKKWRLLDAERNFAKEDLGGIGKGKRLDLLAYEEETRCFIVLELKIERSLKKADAELHRYTSTIYEHIQHANVVYSVNAENVKGYIVWPNSEKPRINDISWGLIEYNKDKLDDIENLKLDIIKEPENN